MPRNHIGQMISFKTISSKSYAASDYWYVNVKKGDTVLKICARIGHSGDASRVAQLNGVHSIREFLRPLPPSGGAGVLPASSSPILVPTEGGKLPSGWEVDGAGLHAPLDMKRLKMPGDLRSSEGLDILAGDTPPVPTTGYAKFDVLDRQSRKGITQFTGYDPLSYDVPVQWITIGGGGRQIERDMRKLEGMAGRGPGDPTPADGAPPVLQVTVTNNQGDTVPLIIPAHQHSARHPTGPLWYINGIAWDTGALRRKSGRRFQAKAVVTLVEYTPIHSRENSASKRAKQRPDPGNPGAFGGSTLLAQGEDL